MVDAVRFATFDIADRVRTINENAGPNREIGPQHTINLERTIESAVADMQQAVRNVLPQVRDDEIQQVVDQIEERAGIIVIGENPTEQRSDMASEEFIDTVIARGHERGNEPISSDDESSEYVPNGINGTTNNNPSEVENPAEQTLDMTSEDFLLRVLARVQETVNDPSSSEDESSEDGANGNNATNGTNGTNGNNATNGTNGTNGNNGTNGTNGTNDDPDNTGSGSSSGGPSSGSIDNSGNGSSGGNLDSTSSGPKFGPTNQRTGLFDWDLDSVILYIKDILDIITGYL